MAAEYLRDAKANPDVLKSGSFAMPMLFRAQEVRDAFGSEKFYEYLADQRGRLYHYGKLDPARAATIDHAIRGVVGMIRFGTGTSPHLYFALGDLLAAREDRHLASRAYRRAIELGHPTPDLIRDTIKMVEGPVDGDSGLSETLIAQERAEAEAWVSAYQKFEDDFLRTNAREPDEADYASFYREHGGPRATPSRFEVTMDRVDAFIAQNTALFWLCVALVVAVVAAAVRGRRRRRGRGHYTLGKTNGVPSPVPETRSMGTP
jgi:hypothetical protein